MKSSWYAKLNTAFMALRYFIIPVVFAIFVAIAHHWPESFIGHADRQWQNSPYWSVYYHQAEGLWNVLVLIILGVLHLALVMIILQKPGHAVLVHWRRRGKPKLAYGKALAFLVGDAALQAALALFIIVNLTFGDDKTTPFISLNTKGWLFIAHMVAMLGMLSLLEANDALPDDYPQAAKSK